MKTNQSDPDNLYSDDYNNHNYINNELASTLTDISLAFLLGVLILCTIIGNVFVIIAILMEKNLRTVSNYLVLSLAIADLMVACMVMPFGAVYIVSGGWNLGSELCDMWTCADVLCCTASILHLLAIAIDRYWAVTNINYIHNRSPRRIVALIVAIWTIAVVISIAPILGWKDPDYERRLLIDKKCLISQDVIYQVVATFATFYGPLVLILLLYWRIYQVSLFIQDESVHDNNIIITCFLFAPRITLAEVFAIKDEQLSILLHEMREYDLFTLFFLCIGFYFYFKLLKALNQCLLYKRKIIISINNVHLLS